MSTSLVMFLVFIAITLGITYWASKRTKTTAEFYSAGREHHGLPERVGGRRRLHVGGVVPRHRRADRLQRLRRVPVLGGLARGVPDRAAAGRRTASQHRQVHDGRRAGVPPPEEERAHDRGVLDADGEPVLHDRADGRRRLARQPADPADLLQQRDRAGRRPDAGLRDLRRHARHDLGADHQGGAADGRHHPAVDPRAGEVRVLDHELLRCDLPGDGHVQGRRGERNHQGLHPARAPLQRHVGRARPDLAGHRADLRHGWSAAHPDPVLHGALGAAGAQVGGVGDDPHRVVLHHDDVPRVRRGDARRQQADRRAREGRRGQLRDPRCRGPGGQRGLRRHQGHR